MESPQIVYIIDDDAAVRDAMGMLLESFELQHKSFITADRYLAQYDGSQRGCLVLDIRMPGMSGLELQSELNARNSTLPIIFMTGHGDIPMAVEAMRLGAIDFMRKPINESELINRIRHSLEHESGTRTKVESIEHNKMLVDSLTKREREVFERVAEGNANKVIAMELGISERTVEVHRAQSMKKLNVKTLAQLVRIHIDIE